VRAFSWHFYAAACSAACPSAFILRNHRQKVFRRSSFRTCTRVAGGAVSGPKQCGDERHAHVLEEEIEALVGELRRATGLCGRDRKAALATERARVNVTRTIKLALTRIGRVHMELENHLVRSIRTGAFCPYQPAPNELVTWCI
jgi:hypothetical protein